MHNQTHPNAQRNLTQRKKHKYNETVDIGNCYIAHKKKSNDPSTNVDSGLTSPLLEEDVANNDSKIKNRDRIDLTSKYYPIYESVENSYESNKEISNDEVRSIEGKDRTQNEEIEIHDRKKRHTADYPESIIHSNSKYSKAYPNLLDTTSKTE